MRTKVLLACSFLVISSLAFPAQNQDLQQFLVSLEKHLEERDFDSYLNAFTPESREKEREAISYYFDNLKMEMMHFHWANKSSFLPDDPQVFLQVISQNSYSALIEIWQLGLERVEAGYRITERKAWSNLSPLYKIKIPADRVERAASVEIRHTDIALIFRDAILFYDNIPGIETALLVLGNGRLRFSPSDESEKHQLHLRFKSRTLEDRIDYAFLRFSTSFFVKNIKIERKDEEMRHPVSQADWNKAYSLFMKHHRRYYTVQSPLTPEPLSFVPQGEEAIFEFQAKKAGDLAYVYSPFAEEEVTLYDQAQDRFLNLYSPASEKGKRRMVITFGQKYDVMDYDIELSFEPKNSHLSARAKISVAARLGPLDAVKFRFNPALEILRIYDEDKRELFFTQDKISRSLYVYFLEPVEGEAVTAIEVYYRGILEPPPQISDTLASFQRSDSFLPIPPQFDTYLFSQSAYWYPSPPSEDYFTARLKVIIPPEYNVVSNGLQLKEGILNGMQRVTDIDKMGSAYAVFRTNTPVKYLTFLVGKLALIKQSEGSLPLFSYVASDVRFPKRNLLEEARRILDAYESWFGPFPFEVLRVVQRLWATGGGHSPASFIVLNDFPRASDGEKAFNLGYTGRSPVDLAEWKEYFLAHEIAHQWWGQGVTWARYRDQWLSEGLAQFASALYIRSKYGDGAFSNILKRFSGWTEKKSKFGPITLGSRLSYLDFEAYQATIYNKSALILNMLHDLLGPEAFFAGLRKFFKTHQYSAAATSDFRRTMETVSGRNLDRFFSLWFDSHLLPEIRASHSVTKREKGFLLRIRVEQEGETFVFPLWVEWQEKKGKDRRREMLFIDRKDQEFEFLVQDKPAKVRINPDRAVPGKIILSRG